MDEFESRLEHELSSLARVPLAEPDPLPELRRRARKVRVGRALTSMVAVATAAVLVGGIIIAAQNQASHAPQKLQVAAPSFVLGDIDAVVLSTTLDADGARAPFSPALAAVVARVPGVQSVSGVIDTFAPINNNGNGTGPQAYGAGDDAGSTQNQATPTPPRTPILFSYHQDDEVHLVAGALPKQAGEIVVDADFISREHTAIGEQVSMEVHSQVETFTIVGTFDLPDTDLTGIPLAALPAADQAPGIELDRLDVKLAPGAAAANVRDAIAIAVGNDYTVAAPGVISVPDQRLAQLEIQHAYWALLSPDPKERSTSGVGPADAQEHANYEKYASLTAVVELRVENVSFLSPDAATLTYRIYYEGSPSPVISDPQTGSATRVSGHWQLGTSTLCSLAALVSIACKATSNVTITPPNGYQPLSTLDPEIKTAFDALADPKAAVAERVAAIYEGERLRPTIEAGLTEDRAYIGKTIFTIAGWRSMNANTVDILYSLQTTGGPSTPWPSTAEAQLAPDGHWYAGTEFACGINALAGGGGCQTPGGAPSSAGILGIRPNASNGGATVTTAVGPARP